MCFTKLGVNSFFIHMQLFLILLRFTKLKNIGWMIFNYYHYSN